MKNTDTSKRGKADQILAGCRQLQSVQSEGQTFSVTEIARACDVDDRTITFIERRALYHVAQKLAAHRGLISEIFNTSPDELFKNVFRDPHRTGRPSVRPTVHRPLRPKFVPTLSRETKAAAFAALERRGVAKQTKCFASPL
jgi:hypothetical protein